MIEPEPLQQVDRTCVLFRNRKLAFFSGCDYYRLSTHPKVMAALETGVKRFGLNVAASRLTTGNHAVYGELERRLADFFGAQSAALVPSGYVTNVIAAQALAGDFSLALIDEGSHPSLADAARFLDCPLRRFRHRSADDLARLAGRCGTGARLLLLTDGMFSHNGAAAPLDEYLKALPRTARILVDDAHGGGVLGKTGRGTLEHAGVSRQRVIQTVTLSKAFGAYGGAILASPSLRQRILDRSRWFVGSTPIPLPLASAALEAIALFRREPRFRLRLAANADCVKAALRKAGFPLPDAPGPIVALVAKRPAAARKLHAALLASGVYPPFIRYPGGPACGYFRFVISSEHTRQQLHRLLEAVLDQDPADFEQR